VELGDPYNAFMPGLARVPVVDVSDLVAGTPARTAVGAEIGRACRAHGFFYVTGHGVDGSTCDRLVDASRRFFALDSDTKMRWRMSLGGRAWRGYFPPGGELTSGHPDWKEGLYLGSELPDDAVPVRSRTPLHGRNLFPEVSGFREAVLAYLDALTRLGHTLMEGIALSLGREPTYFAERYTADPLILFRIFNYPTRPAPEGHDVRWGVGEHTDYGLLTILWQDDVGGLQVKTPEGWIDAPPLPGSFVCNIGDMLDRMTAGLYRSTPHRVALNTSGRDRLSMPFFFDPHFEARVRPIEGLTVSAEAQDRAARWDGANIHAFDGTYGDYLLGKVSKVFPELRREVL
jgi:polar amino acid transport system ATP-binding protein